MADGPPIIGEERGTESTDTAGKLPSSKLRFQPAKITGGGKTFTWPMTEGFSRTGSAQLGIHKYLGRHYVDVHVIHYDEAHITLQGTFAGLTSTKLMRQLIEVLVAQGNKQLSVPGVFSNIQTVYPENYEFNHAEDDRTHSIVYNVSFVRTTTGDKVDSRQTAEHDVSGIAGAPSRGPSGMPGRAIQTTQQMATLRAISDRVYQDAEKWRALVNLNRELDKWNADRGVEAPIPAFHLATKRLNLGTRVRY